MKPFKAVESNRKKYHQWPARNSVHRSAAIFPIMDRALYSNNLTFLNHWLVKRGIKEIGARHTIRDHTGQKLGQVYSVLDRPKAYSIDLEEVMAAAGIEDEMRTGSWEVEFFSAINMFIPYPAVVQFVQNDSFTNQVHAYARVLNDFDEDANVNSSSVDEASVDVMIGDAYDTFVTFINGPVPTESEIKFRLVDQSGSERKNTVPYSAAPYEETTMLLSDVFGSDLQGVDRDHALFVKQPRMQMFYNRLFAGIVKTDAARPLAANHSYYDTSKVLEYFDADPANDRQANITLSLIDDLPLKVRLYPILSPVPLDFSLAYYDKDGTCIVDAKNIAHWHGDGGSQILEIDLTSHSPGSEARSVDLYVTTDAGKVPTRITLQVCYGKDDALSSSINLSLNSPYVFVPENKVGLNWMAVCGGGSIDNHIAVSHCSPFADSDAHEVTVTLYRDEDEEVMTGTLHLKGHAGFGGDLDAVLPGYKDFLDDRNGFLFLESKSPFLRSITLQTNRETGHTSGEHSF